MATMNTEPATASILDCIANLGPRPVDSDDETYTFRRADLDRMVELAAPKPTDSAAGVVNPYLDEISRPELAAEVELVYKEFLEDFQYPTNRKGQPLDLRFLGPHVAWHLVRCGWRPIANRRMIKKIAIGAGPQRIDDAVAWVDISTPDQLDPTTMTVEQLRAAPPHVQAEAIRRLGGDPKPDPSNNGMGAKGHELWHQPWALDADDDPEFKELMTKHARDKRSKQ